MRTEQIHEFLRGMAGGDLLEVCFGSGRALQEA
jgi:hypothetical protein